MSSWLSSKLPVQDQAHCLICLIREYAQLLTHWSNCHYRRTCGLESSLGTKSYTRTSQIAPTGASPASAPGACHPAFYDAKASRCSMRKSFAAPPTWSHNTAPTSGSRNPPPNSGRLSNERLERPDAAPNPTTRWMCGLIPAPPPRCLDAARRIAALHNQDRRENCYLQQTDAENPWLLICTWKAATSTAAGSNPPSSSPGRQRRGPFKTVLTHASWWTPTAKNLQKQASRLRKTPDRRSLRQKIRRRRRPPLGRLPGLPQRHYRERRARHKVGEPIAPSATPCATSSPTSTIRPARHTVARTTSPA